MKKTAYNKAPLSYEDQLNLLESRGLKIENRDKALHLLQRLSYYRLSGYWYPLLKAPKENHHFTEGATFERAFKLYCFDRELRLLIMREIEKNEVAVRAEISYVMSMNYGAFWFSDISLFKSRTAQNKFSQIALESVENSDEAFIQNYKKRYSEPIPPSWITLEVISFGALSKLYQNLKPSAETRKIANSFGLSDRVLSTWLHALVYVRNICAHHSRLWNKTLRIQPKIPKSTDHSWLTEMPDNRRVYFILSIIKYLLIEINPKSTLPIKLDTLLKNYPAVDPNALGFAKNWKEETLWKT